MSTKFEPKSFNVALAGNKNVGKTTIFNQLVQIHKKDYCCCLSSDKNINGCFTYMYNYYNVINLPSLESIFNEELENFDAVVIICDATKLEQELFYVLKLLEENHRVIVCLNLMDLAKKNNIKINLQELENQLGVPVISTTAKSGKGINRLLNAIHNICYEKIVTIPAKVSYITPIEESIGIIECKLTDYEISKRFTAVKILNGEEYFIEKFSDEISTKRANAILLRSGISPEDFSDKVSICIKAKANKIVRTCVKIEKPKKRFKFKKELKYIAVILSIFISFFIIVCLCNYLFEFLEKLI